MDTKRTPVDIIDPDTPVGTANPDRSTIDGIIDDLSKPAGRTPEPQRWSGFDVINPVDADLIDVTTRSDGNSDRGTSPSKHRGRPFGSRNRPKDEPSTKTASNLIADLESLLLSVHFMGAALLSVPELELDKEEADKLAKAVRNVAKHYSVNIDPKKLAMFELSTTAAAIYGPRAIAIYKNHQKPKTPKPVLEMPNKQTAPKQAVNGQAPLSSQATRPFSQMTPSDLVGFNEPPTDSFSL